MLLSRRHLLLGTTALAAGQSRGPGFRLVDVTQAAGIAFQHNTGAFGAKYLPETMGPGCAFLDYDSDGWMDILLVNGMDWPGHKRTRTTLKLYRNNRNGAFSDVTRAAGLDVELYGLGVAVADFDNDGFPDLFISCVGQSRLYKNNGKGGFIDVTQRAGLMGREGFSTSALWFDYDRDGLLDLFVCNYVRWSAASDVRCSLDGKRRSYCTPEAYRGSTCWLFRNRGDGTFEDVTAVSGVLDSSSKSLGVAMFDYEGDGWPDLFVANDTQPNKLYRNQQNGKFQEMALRANLAFSEDGKARAGMGADIADFDNSGSQGVVVTNFTNEMLGLFRSAGEGVFIDQAARSELGQATRQRLGFGCFFFDADLDGWLDLLVVNGHIDETVEGMPGGGQHAQPPHLFRNSGGRFRDVAGEMGGEFASPKIGRGAAYADIDNDGDLDILITTNGGPAHLYRNDQIAANKAVRFRLRGTKSNRDAIGAQVRLYASDLTARRQVKTGSSYLSQSELPVTFGLGQRDRIERVVVEWPSGRVEEYRKVAPGSLYEIQEEKGITAVRAFSTR